MNKIYQITTYFIAMAWFINGLFCKVLNLVPRHQEIVSTILSEEYGKELTVLIGISEIVMSVWILSRVLRKLNAVSQILLVLGMNILEIILVPDLLLWGKFNIIFAILFIALIYHNEFVLYLRK